MGNQVYPNYIRGFSIIVYKAFEFSNIVQRSSAGFETRIAQYKNPIRHYQFIYNYLKDIGIDLPPGGAGYTDLKSLLGFFEARQADFDDFLFDDVKNDFVGPGLNPDTSPNLNAQLPLVTDGTNWFSPLQTITAGQFAEDITDLIPSNVAGSLQLWANGAPAPSGGGSGPPAWSLAGPGLAVPGASYGGLYVAWASAPTGPITAQFSFYQRLRFDGPQFDFEMFVNDIYTIGGPDTRNGTGVVKLITSRPNINI